MSSYTNLEEESQQEVQTRDTPLWVPFAGFVCLVITFGVGIKIMYEFSS